MDTSQLKGDDLIDWKFGQSILAGKEIEQAQMQSWRKDPRLYMTFTGLSALLESPKENSKKMEEVKQQLDLSVQQMQNGMRQLDVYVVRFQELGLFMAENGRVLFEKELPAFIKKLGDEGKVLEAPAKEAKEALEKYIAFLKDELPKKSAGKFAIGTGIYNEMLKRQYLLEYDADSLYRFGWDQFNKTVKELEEPAKKINPTKTWQQLAVEIKNDYPAPHSMIEVHQEWVNKCREHVLQHKLIPIPWKERVKVVARAEYLRKTSYYGHFSFAKAKDADSIYTSEMHINPFEDQWD